MDVYKLLEQVEDEASFLQFARALEADRRIAAEKETERPGSPYGRDAGGWENVTIESYLEAAISWAEATNFGSTQGVGDAKLWKKFAVFLYCGKIYE